MKSTAYGKSFPRRIRPQNGHGYSVAAPHLMMTLISSEGQATEGRPYIRSHR
jgi:hypothetical protein